MTRPRDRNRTMTEPCADCTCYTKRRRAQTLPTVTIGARPERQCKDCDRSTTAKNGRCRACAELRALTRSPDVPLTYGDTLVGGAWVPDPRTGGATKVWVPWTEIRRAS